jgi:hypothetical protein
MATKYTRLWSDPATAEARPTCRASTGPSGSWTDGNKVEAPYTICGGSNGWAVMGKINGCDWYVTKAVDDPQAKREFRTWRCALVAVRRLYPGAAVILRTRDRAERPIAA